MTLELYFIILAISSGLTMDVENHRIVTEIIESHHPSYWGLHNPDGYRVYFRSKDKNSANRAKNLYESIADLIASNNLFEHFSIGTSEGAVVTELDWRGRVVFEPLGSPVNEAYRSQKGKSELAG